MYVSYKPPLDSLLKRAEYVESTCGCCGGYDWITLEIKCTKLLGMINDETVLIISLFMHQPS